MKKRNKKRWIWTDKQVRKHRNYYYRRTAPTWYCKLLNKSNKTKTKQSLNKIMRGFDSDFLEFGKTNHKHEAEWLWW